MGEIRTLSIAPVVRASDGKPDADLIELIERLLVEVKSGEVQGVAFAAVYSDGAFKTDWTGNASALQTLGAITMLFQEFGASVKNFADFLEGKT